MTECSKCGDCCENIETSWTLAHLESVSAKEGADSPNTKNYEFVRDNWVSQLTEPQENYDRWTCLKFDPVERLCTAHEDRPPICSGYPWYGKEPDKSRILDPRCSFQADIKTMLPIVEVTHGNALHESQ